MALLKPSGWSDSANAVWESAGGIASSVQNFFSGMSKQNRDAIKEEREKQAEAMNEYELSEQKGATTMIKLMAFLKQYWIYLTAGLVVFIGLIIFLRKRKKSPYRRRKVKTVTRISRRTGKVKRKRIISGGFRRKIHGRTYTSRKAWGAAMRRLKK